VILTVGAFMSALVGLSWFVGGQLAEFARELPGYRSHLEQRVREGRALFSGGMIQNLSHTINGVLDETGLGAVSGSDSRVGSGPPPSVGSWLGSIGAVTDPLTTFGLVLVLSTLLLLQWADLRGRLLSFVAGNVSHTTQLLNDAGKRIGRYLMLQFFYNTSFGVAVAVGLTFLQVPYAALWGLCAALFRYLPYVGPLLAAALPLFVSLVTSTGWAQPGAVLLLFLGLELVSNNFVEPWLYGSKLGVSELGIILMTLVWTYLWGAAGLLLATPLTVCLVVLGTHVPCLAFFARLLGNEDELNDAQKVYQRLLAADVHEAAAISRNHVRKHGRDQHLTELLLPALALARRDERAHWLPEESLSRLRADVGSLLEEIQSHLDDGETAALTGRVQSGKVLLWSVCPFTDLALPLLADDSESGCAACSTVPSTQLVGAALQDHQLASERPTGICIVYLSAADAARAEGLARRLRKALPETPLAIACLVQQGSEDQRPEVPGVTTIDSWQRVRHWLAAHAQLLPQMA
jgi:predicted PurR-regulated permease PerM